MFNRQLKTAALTLIGSCVLLLPASVLGSSRAIAQTGNSTSAIAQAGSNPSQKLESLNQLFKQGRDLVTAGDYISALEVYRQAALIDGTNPKVFAGMGYLYASQGFYREAVTSYQNALILDRKNPDYFYALGYAQANLQDYQGAIQSYRQAIALNRNLGEAYLGLAASYARLGDLATALSTYRQLLGVNPNNSWALEGIGEILLSQKQYGLALQNLQLAAQNAPKRGSIQALLGRTYIAQGNTAAGQAALLAAGQLEPENAEVQVEIAQALQDIGNPEQALSFYRRAIAQKPNLAVAYAGMADIYLLQKDYVAAVRAYQQVIQLLPQNPQGFFNLGLALKGEGNKAEASQAFQKSRTIFEIQGNAAGVRKAEQAIRDLESTGTSLSPT